VRSWGNVGSEGRGVTAPCNGVVIADLHQLFLTRLPTTRTSRSGYYEFKCPLCSDYKVRAGIRFDATEIKFNCFNCPGSFVFKDGDCHIGKRIDNLFKALGGDLSDMAEIKRKLLVASVGETATTEVRIDGITEYRSPPVIEVPSSFVSLEEAVRRKEPGVIKALQYLDKRKIQVDTASVMIDTSMKKDNPWKDRVIFPVVMWNKVVGLTGRAWNPKLERYHTLGSKGRMIFNYDVTTNTPERPLRVDGVAVMGNHMSPHQIHWLRQVNRRKIIIPDTGHAGYPMIEQAVSLGWDVSLPDFGSRKDVDAAVASYGLLYVTKQLLSSIHSGETALLKGRAYCT
jgi:hypothetical protein